MSAIAGIIVQYILSITSILVSVIVCIISFSGYSSILNAVLQIIIAVSSNICSIACTIQFYFKSDEEKDFQYKRTIIIVISLVVNLILVLLNSLQNDWGCINQTVICLLCAALTVRMLVVLVDMQTEVSNINSKSINTLSELDKEKVYDAKCKDTMEMEDVIYFVEGEKE